MSLVAAVLFVFCAALIGFFLLVAWGIADAAGEEYEEKRRLSG